MSDSGLMDAYDCLGLEPGADRAAVEKACRHMKALYGEETLATYGLFDEEERTRMLEEIEAACRRINAAEGRQQRPHTPAGSASESILPLDDATHPAAYLRQARENSGLSLQEIARHTKIGTRYLAMIEEERYEALPAPVYLRGFVFDYARMVGVPSPEEVARRYLEHCREALHQQD